MKYFLFTEGQNPIMFVACMSSFVLFIIKMSFFLCFSLELGAIFSDVLKQN